MGYKLFWTVVLFFITTANSCAWWPIYRFPAVKGVVIDSTTLKPIENVVVGCGYSKKIGVLVDNASKGISSRVAITDKEGKYSFPGKTVLHLLPAWFPLGGAFQYRFGLCFKHPLYEPHSMGGNPDAVASWDTMGELIDGTVYYNTALLTLDEKYVREILTETDTVKRRKLIVKFSGVMFGKLGFVIAVFEGEEPFVKLNWAEILSKYEEYVAIVANIEPKTYYNERLEQLAKAKKLWLEHDKQNEGEK